MALAARKEPTPWEALMDLPENTVGEILAGELHVSPRPAPRHANAASRLGFAVGGEFDNDDDGSGDGGGWRILFEPELHLDGDILVPDLAGWRRERLPSLPDEAFFSLAPDWVCEVLSPSTELRDRSLKAPIYAREGVGHLWLVNPLARTLEILELVDGRWQIQAVYGGDVKVRPQPFEAAELDLSRWWA